MNGYSTMCSNNAGRSPGPTYGLKPWGSFNNLLHVFDPMRRAFTLGRPTGHLWAQGGCVCPLQRVPADRDTEVPHRDSKMPHRDSKFRKKVRISSPKLISPKVP